MSLDPKTKALMADVDAIRARIERQLKADPCHEVAVAMFQADLRHAERRLSKHIAAQPVLESSRRLVA
jgi:hypothetical protein